jgi:hypothetical protein
LNPRARLALKTMTAVTTNTYSTSARLTQPPLLLAPPPCLYRHPSPSPRVLTHSLAHPRSCSLCLPVAGCQSTQNAARHRRRSQDTTCHQDRGRSQDTTCHQDRRRSQDTTCHQDRGATQADASATTNGVSSARVGGDSGCEHNRHCAECVGSDDCHLDDGGGRDGDVGSADASVVITIIIAATTTTTIVITVIIIVIVITCRWGCARDNVRGVQPSVWRCQAKRQLERGHCALHGVIPIHSVVRCCMRGVQPRSLLVVCSLPTERRLATDARLAVLCRHHARIQPFLRHDRRVGRVAL